MADKFSELQARLGKAADDLAAAIYAFEHAVADTDDVKSATLACRVIGGCYSAFDRVNIAAISRKAHLEVSEMIK